MKLARALALLAVLAATVGCSRKPDAGALDAAAPSASIAPPGDADAGAAPLLKAWAHAESMTPEDLAALAAVEGAAGLVAGAEASPERRRVAVAALAYAPSQLGLPFLAGRARDGDDEEALAAARSIHALASRRRTAEDWEDDAEVREGTSALLAIARNDQKPRALRVLLVSALRMYADAGVVKSEEIVTNVDAS